MLQLAIYCRDMTLQVTWCILSPKGIGSSSRVWGFSTSNDPIFVGLALHKSLINQSAYLYLTTTSPSYKYKQCCLCSLQLVTKCYGTGGLYSYVCIDTIKTPPNIKSITTILYFVVGTTSLTAFHQHLVGINVLYILLRFLLTPSLISTFHVSFPPLQWSSQAI